MLNCPEVDTQILSYLDNTSLYSIAQVNRYLRDLSQTNTLWKLKVKRISEDYLQGKEPEENWKDYYLVLRGVISSNGELDLFKLVDLERLNLLKQCRNEVNVKLANYAAEKGKITVLSMFGEEKMSLPDENGFTLATRNAHGDVARWMVRQGLVDKYIDDLRDRAPPELASLVIPTLSQLGLFLPTQEDINRAVVEMTVSYLKFMAFLQAPLPDQNGANMAAGFGRVDILEWMKENNLPLPDQTGANLAAENKKEEVLTWMKKNGLPSPNGEPVQMKELETDDLEERRRRVENKVKEFYERWEQIRGLFGLFPSLRNNS